jgi:hypothetical protein
MQHDHMASMMNKSKSASQLTIRPPGFTTRAISRGDESALHKWDPRPTM